MDAFTIAISFAISSAIVGAFFLPGIRIGLSTADEAYLHFGSVNLLEGKIPIRDFRAYDPGRYYWCALWMRFLGPTFLTQRLAMGFIMILALTLTCFWVFYVSQNWTVAILATLLSFIWMRPYFKAFEILFSLVAVTVTFFIISDPGVVVYLLSGFVVGIALFFGLNIGLYAGLSFLLALGFSFVVQLAVISIMPMVWMLLGFALSICPVLLLGLKNPGYFSMYWEKKIITVLKRGTSNLPLPLPWLWMRPAQLRSLSSSRQLFFKIIFTGVTPFYLLSFAVGLLIVDEYLTAGDLIISASLVGLVYLHYLFSRADVSHLWQSIHPALLLVSILSATFLSWPWAALLLASLGALSAWMIIPQWSTLFNFIGNRKQYVTFETGREALKLTGGQAANFTTLKQIIDTYSKEEDTAFFAPSAPGFYQLFNRQPALYDVYCIYPETDENQSMMIKLLGEQRTSIIIIYEQRIDNNDNLMFSKTHPQVWHFLNNHYDRLEQTKLPGFVKVFTKTQ